jgi:hypothetical protein
MTKSRADRALDRLADDAYHVDYGRRREDEDMAADITLIRSSFKRRAEPPPGPRLV